MKHFTLSIVGACLLSACGIERMTEEMLGKVKLQALEHTCGRLVSPEERLNSYTQYERLAALTASARACGGEASPTLLIELTYVLLRTVNSPGDSSVENVRTRYLGLGTLAAYMPEEKFKAILDEQITKGGRFYSQAHQLAALRYFFIQEYRLKPIYEESEQPEGLNRFTVTQLQEAVALYKQLTAIATSPYKDRFAFKSGNKDVALDLSPQSRDDSQSWLAGHETLAETISEKFLANSIDSDRDSAQAKDLLQQLK